MTTMYRLGSVGVLFLVVGCSSSSLSTDAGMTADSKTEQAMVDTCESISTQYESRSDEAEVHLGGPSQCTKSVIGCSKVAACPQTPEYRQQDGTGHGRYLRGRSAREYESALMKAEECTLGGPSQCTKSVIGSFYCECMVFVNGDTDTLASISAHFNANGCRGVCTGSCAIESVASCQVDSTSSTGARCLRVLNGGP